MTASPRPSSVSPRTEPRRHVSLCTAPGRAPSGHAVLRLRGQVLPAALGQVPGVSCAVTDDTAGPRRPAASAR
jgi:hypothetical protein